MIDPHRPLRILFSAGEVSGDRQAAHLARAIFLLDPGVRLYGTGGEMMRQAGVDVLVQTSQYGSVGVQESLRFVRPLRRVMQQMRQLIRQETPDLAVLVDNEGFNGVVSRFLHREGVPLIYYFPPQVWLWGEWRAKTIAARAHAIIPAFPQEAEIYRREGGRTFWVGHPLLDIVKPDIPPEDAFALAGLDPGRRTIALMPGSRLQEIEQLMTPILHAARLMKKRHPGLQMLLPPAAPHLMPAIISTLRKEGMDEEVRLVNKHVYACLKKCDLAILSSGTATLEAALLGLPMVVAYKVSAVTSFLARRLLKCRFIAMPNILLDDRVVPELIQHHVTAEALAEQACTLLEDPNRRQTMISRLEQVRTILGKEGTLHAAAEFILREAVHCRRPMAA